MKIRCWRYAFMAAAALLLAGCGNKQTREALEKSANLEAQKQYRDANDILVQALQARETKLRADAGMPADAATPPDAAAADAMLKKIQSDPEILKMERAQILLYLQWERPDLASGVYADILAGSPNDPVIHDAVKDKDPLIRTGAVHVLGLMANAADVPVLADATKDANQDVRRTAVVALGGIKDPGTVAPLIAALKDSFWFVRSEAAEALGPKHDERAVKPLLDTLDDSDTNVSGSAQASLVVLSTPPDSQTAPAAKPDDFIAGIASSDQKVAVTSAICLALFKDARAVPVLEKMVESTDPQTRLDAVKGLGETGDPSVIPILRQTLKDPDVNMRGWSIIGLGELKDEDSVLDLQDIAMDVTQPDSIRGAAAVAVKKIKGNSATTASP